MVRTRLVRVFLIEDNRNMQAALRSLLTADEGFEIVRTAVGNFTAQEWLQEHPQGWDVVSIDLLLDDGGGFGLIRRCKTLHPEGKVVVFSNYVTDTIREHCIALGADAVFGTMEIREYSDYLRGLVHEPPP